MVTQLFHKRLRYEKVLEKVQNNETIRSMKINHELMVHEAFLDRNPSYLETHQSFIDDYENKYSNLKLKMVKDQNNFLFSYILEQLNVLIDKILTYFKPIILYYEPGKMETHMLVAQSA